jgi:hypothetical protein
MNMVTRYYPPCSKRSVPTNFHIEIIGAALICLVKLATGRSVMISKSTIGAMVLVAMGLTPAFAQVPQGYYAASAPYATPYNEPEPFGLAPYGYGNGYGWQSQSAGSINYW